MKFETILGKLVAEHTDLEGYTTYVFQKIDQEHSDYLMCVRYPNWNSVPVKLGDIGFVKYSCVEAGIDQWWDGVNMNKFRYDDVIFYKFIEKPEEPSNELFL